jgi:hypothetical protein
MSALPVYQYTNGEDCRWIAAASKMLADVYARQRGWPGGECVFPEGLGDSPTDPEEVFRLGVDVVVDADGRAHERNSVLRTRTAYSSPTLTSRDLGTILAALRYWQREGLHSGGAEHDIASDGGGLFPLDAEEIDELCERINR